MKEKMVAQIGKNKNKKEGKKVKRKTKQPERKQE